MRDIHLHKYSIDSCICFSYVCHFPIHHNGFHNNGGAAEGALPLLWRRGRLYSGGWGSGKREKQCAHMSNIYLCVKLADFMIFPFLTMSLLRILCGYWDMGAGKHKRYHKICDIYTYINIRYIVAYVFPMFATSPSTIMEAAFGRLHNNGGGPPSATPPLLWNPLWWMGKWQT